MAVGPLPETARGRPGQGGPHDTSSAVITIPDPSDVARLLALSQERDTCLRLRLTAWREGYMAGRASRADDYSAGVADGILACKAVQHGIVRDLRQHLRTWDGLRSRFADPRPGDYPRQGEVA